MKRKNEFEEEFEKNSKKSLQTMVTKYSLKDDEESDGSDSEDDWVLATHKCKICKYGHKSLIQHLKKNFSCGQEYSESEWMDLRNGVKMIKRSKEYFRKKRNYKNNREVVLQRNRESYARNKDKYKPTRAAYYKANAENLKNEYQESKKNYEFEEKLKWKTSGRKFRIDELLTGYENKSRSKNKREKDFLLHTRIHFIEKLGKETLTNRTTEVLTQLKQLVFSKYNSFEKDIDAIMTHKKDLEEIPWKTEEEWDAFQIFFDNITKQFHQLCTVLAPKDAPECPNRIMKEWKEVQDEMDMFLLNISEELNEPLSYSTNCYSDKHLGYLKCYCQDLEKQVIVRKRKPIDFTMEDLEQDKEEGSDEDFIC